MFRKLEENTEHAKYRHDRYKTDTNQSLRGKKVHLKLKINWMGLNAD